MDSTKFLCRLEIICENKTAGFIKALMELWQCLHRKLGVFADKYGNYKGGLIYFSL